MSPSSAAAVIASPLRRSIASLRGALAAACLFSACLAVPVLASESDEIGLAERLAVIADGYDNSAASGLAKASLYDAAGRLSDREIRFRRQRFRASESAADLDGMLASLVEWRKLEPEKIFVQMRLIDSYLARMDTADARLNYLKSIVDSEPVNSEVRSHAALQMAKLLVEQSRLSQANDLLKRSLTLNPLNVGTLQMQWQLARGRSTPLERVNLLLAIVKADPGSVDAVIRVAEELADLKMVQQSIVWYGHATNMSRSMGGLAGTPQRDFISELLIAGQDRAAAEMTSRMLEKDSTNPGAWFLTLIAERDIKDRIEPVKRSARVGLLNRLAMTRRAMGVVEATTRPLAAEDATIPSFEGDLDLLKKAEPSLVEQYVTALSDVAWLELYYAQRADEAGRVIKQLAAAAPQEKLLLARLEGWRLLLAGDLAKAKETLAPIAQSDPYAALGMVRVLQKDPSTASAATDLARKLLRAYPAGMPGALINSEVGQLAGELPREAVVDAIQDSLDRFPRETLRMTAAPQEFVVLRMSPQQVGHEFAEPMLVEFELRNVSDYPIVMGPDGMVKDLMVDVQMRGLIQEWVPGVLYQKADGPAVLPPGGNTKWMVRLDVGPLNDVTDQNVLQAIQLTVFGFTNPVPTEVGMLPGPGGIKSRMTQLLERRPASLANEPAMRKARAVMEGSDPQAKMRLADQIAAHLRIAADPEGPQPVKLLQPELREMLLQMTQDPSQPVRLWAKFRRGQTAIDLTERTAEELAADASWFGRTLGAISALATPEATRNRLIETLKSDPDPTVRRLAASIGTAVHRKKHATNPRG